MELSATDLSSVLSCQPRTAFEMSEAYGGTSTPLTVPLLAHTRDRSWRSPLCVVHLSHGAQLEVFHVTADYSDTFPVFLEAPSLMAQDHPATRIVQQRGEL